MEREFEKILKNEKQILETSPRIRIIVAGVMLVFGIVLLILDVAFPAASRFAAASGTCFGIVAIAFVSYLEAIQAKLSLEIVKAINELKARFEKDH